MRALGVAAAAAPDATAPPATATETSRAETMRTTHPSVRRCVPAPSRSRRTAGRGRDHLGFIAMRMTEFTDAAPGPRAIAVGTFDGVHVGHREVIGDADTVLTFEPHPVAVIAPSHMPKLLTPLAVKAEI